ncbi:MAG: VOC family protein [Rhizobiaceae bacterium]|nr:VOC family protein [Rhizobiaceae bacterium]
MTPVILEHINFTVRDAKATADELCSLFDWKVRWHGGALDGEGETYHVGSDNSYLALYSPKVGADPSEIDSYTTQKGLNHIGLVVSDIDAMEGRVKAAGYEPGPQWDYEPGRRFYFHNRDGIEIEVVSYS